MLKVYRAVDDDTDDGNPLTVAVQVDPPLEDEDVDDPDPVEEGAVGEVEVVPSVPPQPTRSAEARITQ